MYIFTDNVSLPGLFPLAILGGGFSEKGMTVEAPSRLATRFDDDPGRGRNVSYFFFILFRGYVLYNILYYVFRFVLSKGA